MLVISVSAAGIQLLRFPAASPRQRTVRSMKNTAFSQAVELEEAKKNQKNKEIYQLGLFTAATDIKNGVLHKDGLQFRMSLERFSIDGVCTSRRYSQIS